MKVSLASSPPFELAVDALAVPVATGQKLGLPALEIDRALGGLLSELIESGEHRGRLHETLPVATRGLVGARRILLYGLGSLADLDGQRLRNAHHELVRAARTYGYRRLGLLASPPLDASSLAAVVEGCVMGGWERRSRQTAPRPDRIELDEILLAGFGPGGESEVAGAVQLAEATNQAREWVNMPGNELTPAAMAEEARKIAERHHLEFEVLGPAELRAGGYNLLLAVAAGSTQEPRLIRLRSRPDPPPAGDLPVLAMVGKGITFDSGGISLKKPEGMAQMKGDMAGAAAVLAAMDVIAARRLRLDVMAVVAATENMPGGSATRPGDVVTSSAGKTVEIVNTDAEGRLVLADAITHALRHGANHVIDLATLTGAAITAIGHAATAAMSNDDLFWGQVAGAAEQSGDKVWRLPLYPDYRVLLRSSVADLKNGEYGEAGAITAAMFIQEFVQGTAWAHLDIAGSAWNDHDALTTIPRGPTGAGTRLLVHLAQLLAGSGR